MPTSANEAKQIQEIMNVYLTQDQAKEITIRLDEEVGQLSDNESLRISLSMLRNLYA